MTNGEIIQKAFNCEVCEPIIEDDIIHVIFADKKDSAIGFDLSWWNAEYKEPTTKNDLGVDCISREQALVAIRYLYPSMPRVDFNGSLRKWVDNYKPYIECDDAIKQLPPVTPQESGWIPVSERLPEDRREVLVTAYWHETYQVMMASYFGDGLWWCVPFNNCGEHMQRLKPKAWMPLPSSYEKGEEV